MKRLSLHALMDTPALYTAMAVDAMSTFATMMTVSQGVLERVALGLLSAVAVLFAVRAWMLGGVGRVVWAMFAVATCYLGISMGCAVVEAAVHPVANPSLISLDADIADSKAAVAELRSQYRDASQRATMDQLDAQISAEEEKQARYRHRRDEIIASEPAPWATITSATIGSAVPSAVASGDVARITWLCIFALLFAGLNLTTVTAASQEGKRMREEAAARKAEPVRVSRRAVTPDESPAPHAPKHAGRQDDVTKWVNLGWQYIVNGRGNKLMSREAFDRNCARVHCVYPPDLYAKLLGLALAKGLVTGADGVYRIAEPDKAKVEAVLRGAL